eukprot:906165-Prymnesium_polylepis.1
MDYLQLRPQRRARGGERGLLALLVETDTLLAQRLFRQPQRPSQPGECTEREIGSRGNAEKRGGERGGGRVWRARGGGGAHSRKASAVPA